MPAVFLNLATGALSKKLETELYLKQSGLAYTIVRCEQYGPIYL